MTVFQKRQDNITNFLKLWYRSDIAMHCRTDMQSLRLTRSNGIRTGQGSVGHSEILSQEKTPCGAVSGQTLEKANSSKMPATAVTVLKSMHIWPQIGNGVTFEGRI